MIYRALLVTLKYLYFIVLFLLVFYGNTQAGNTDTRDTLYIPFIANEGQVDRKIAYYTNLGGVTVYVTRDGDISYTVAAEDEFTLVESFADSREGEMAGRNRTGTVVNFYRGSDPSRWHEAVKTFRDVTLGRKYHNIEIVLAAVRGAVEKIFTVYPGGDVADIAGRIQNADMISVEKSGHLAVRSSRGTIFFTPPVAYQERNGQRFEVSAAYQLHGNSYGFTVGDYDKTLPLVIDPLLASTYVGGKSNENVYDLGTSGGDIIVAGTVDSSDFPGAKGEVDPLGDAFVLRMDSDLSTVRAATYFGGSMTDGVRAVAVETDAIYAAGFNNSPNFPTTHGAAYSGSLVSGAFVVRLDPGTLRITASTALPPNVFGLARSPLERTVYVAGSTGDTGFPIPGENGPAYQSTHRGGADSFLIALDEDLAVIKGATLLGGEGFDIIYDLAVDDRGYPVAAGITNSAAFPVSEDAFGSAYNLDWEASHQWIDGFVVRFSPDLGSLESATYLGGGRNDSITALAAEGSLVLVGGSTASSDFPCGSTFGPVDGSDAFVALFNEDLSILKSCMVFGGSRPGTETPESISDLAFHPAGSIFTVGKTNAYDFPTTPGVYMPAPTGAYFGAFVTSFTRDLTGVEASTLVQGGGEDLKALAIDVWGDVIVAGDTTGNGYPVTAGAVQPDHKGGDDLVISRFTSDLTGPHIEVWPDAMDLGSSNLWAAVREEIVIHNTGGSGLTVSGVELLPGSSAAFAIDNHCRLIPAFDSCSMEVIFEPAVTGRQEGELVINSNDTFRRQVFIALKGRGDTGAFTESPDGAGPLPVENLSRRVRFVPDPFDLGEIEKGQSLSKTVEVSNTGNGDLLVDRVNLEQRGSGPFRVALDGCSGAVLRPGKPDGIEGSQCEITVEFIPVKVGKVSGRLVLVSGDTLAYNYAVDLAGTGLAPEGSSYPGFWGWVGILIIVLRMILGLPVSAGGWGKWINKRDKR